MFIELAPQVALDLEFLVGLTSNEFSGFGFVETQPDRFYVYEVVLLGGGGLGYTVTDTKKQIKLLEREDANKMKLWFHRHPLGNGIPGSHNWSATDDETCKKEPLGSFPELVRWSISIVRTRLGWVGRFDNYIKDTTVHLKVVPNPNIVLKAELNELQIKYEDELLKERMKRLTTKNPFKSGSKLWQSGSMLSRDFDRKFDREFNFDQLQEVLGEDITDEDIVDWYDQLDDDEMDLDDDWLY